eukprot:TRINITY_DN1698_c0_g1_i1.p1 TRINITY_DN1698_c0_g1~~TRINITY_DN1698_c0_g1_i1.p1  ORF type:complete len:167 (-),score=34.26 TRINITY_DN1698_c0_g1_i1:55-555(-)
MKIVKSLWIILGLCMERHWTGYVYPTSVWVGDSPVLQFLLKCQLVKEKMNGLSTDDIYTNKQVEKGLIKLQILTNLSVTGVADDKVLKMVKTNKCPVKAQKPLKLISKQKTQKACRCNAMLDYNGNGECRSTFQGYRWCYVDQGSGCRDRRWTGGTWWSWAACSRR